MLELRLSESLIRASVPVPVDAAAPVVAIAKRICRRDRSERSVTSHLPRS
jgi:hypothetical protein